MHERGGSPSERIVCKRKCSEVQVWGFWEIHALLFPLSVYDGRVGESSEGGSILRDMVQVLDALGVISECGVFFNEGFCTKHGGLE